LKSEYGLISSYWKKGNQNEIDIVTINDLDKKIKLSEVKMDPAKINLNQLKEKSAHLARRMRWRSACIMNGDILR